MPKTIQQAQRQSPLPLLEQHMLWSHVLGVQRAWLIAHDRDPIAAADWDQYHTLQAQRHGGVPMAYLLGWREFMGHRFEEIGRASCREGRSTSGAAGGDSGGSR